MNGDQAILDRAPAEAALEPSGDASREMERGSWLQLGGIARFEWNRFELPLPTLSRSLDGLRVLHLSDPHLKSAWYAAYATLHERLRHDEPDLILITGDFVDDKFDARPAMPLVERFVRGLRCRFGVYAVSGNHDGDFVLPRVAGMGVNVLPIGQPRRITIRGAQIEFIGLAGLDRNDLRAQHVLDVPPRDAHAGDVPRLALSHYPNALVTLQAHGVAPDVYFAGHTHGGQVCLPGGIPILRHDTLPRRYCTGVHRLGDTWLVVSRGMGFSNYPVRLFCPAEVVEVVLRDRTSLDRQAGSQ